MPLHVNLGVALQKLNVVDEAITAYQTAIDLAPGLVQAHWNLSQALMLKSVFPEGWTEFEWRLLRDDFAHLRSNLPRPHEIAKENAVCLVQSEQGFGDLLQFVRFLPAYRQLLRPDAKLFLRCPDQARRLLDGVPGVYGLEPPGGRPLRPYDASVPLLSLPLALRLRAEDIPAQVPYLKADERLALEWNERIPRNAFNVGLCWAGSPTHKNDRNRSIPLSDLAPLANIDGVRLHSLQKGAGQLAPGEAPGGIRINDLAPLLGDFADTAAAIANLDLVIAVDTSVAHLAGALGARTWILLPFAPDWRWGLSSDTTPWYPTARLHRQRAIGDWAPVVEKAAADLGSATK